MSTGSTVSAIDSFLQESSTLVAGLAPLLAPTGAGAALALVPAVVSGIQAILDLVTTVSAQNGPPTLDQWAALLKTRDAAIAQATGSQAKA